MLQRRAHVDESGRYPPRHAAVLLTAVGVIGLLTGCAETNTAAAASPLTAPPPDAAQVNVTKHVVLPEGASADVTVKGLTMQVLAGRQYAVLHVEITGRSATPFPYDEDHFAWQWASDTYPWHSEERDITGPEPEAYAVFVPPLKRGTLALDQHIDGSVPFLPGSAGGRFLVHEYAPDTSTEEATWSLPNPVTHGWATN